MPDSVLNRILCWQKTSPVIQHLTQCLDRQELLINSHWMTIWASLPLWLFSHPQRCEGLSLKRLRTQITLRKGMSKQAGWITRAETQGTLGLSLAAEAAEMWWLGSFPWKAGWGGKDVEAKGHNIGRVHKCLSSTLSGMQAGLPHKWWHFIFYTLLLCIHN